MEIVDPQIIQVIRPFYYCVSTMGSLRIPDFSETPKSANLQQLNVQFDPGIVIACFQGHPARMVEAKVSLACGE